MIKIKGPAIVPEGTYQATFEGLEEAESKKDGNRYYRWYFTVRVANETKDISGTSSLNTGPMSKAYGWFSGLLGRKPSIDEDVDDDGLVGTACLVVIETNDNGYSTITDVLPAPVAADQLSF